MTRTREPAAPEVTESRRHRERLGRRGQAVASLAGLALASLAGLAVASLAGLAVGC